MGPRVQPSLPNRGLAAPLEGAWSPGFAAPFRWWWVRGSVAGMRRSLVILLLLTAACGRTGGSTPLPETTTTTPTATTAETTTSTTAADSALTISIVNFAFQGHSQATVGDTIDVVNADSVTHTWTASEGAFHSGNLSPGDTFTFTFDQPGEFDYFCQIHPSMSGSITVEG